MTDASAAEALVSAVLRLGGRHDEAAAAATDLKRRYAEAHRSYHGTAHVEAVLRDCAVLAEETGLDEQERAMVALAACAHDVIYDARPGDDERASADWARTWLSRAALERSIVDRVAELVLATLSHTAPPGDPGAAVLLDADLAILAARPVDYAAYAAAVRAEYAALADDDWRLGRSAVLSALLARPRLYVTEPAHARWEEHARRNVAAELDSLSPAPS